MRIALLAVLADHLTLVELVLPQELLGIQVAARVDVDLGEGVVDGGVLGALLHPRLQQRQHQLHAVPLLHLEHELVNAELPAHGHDRLRDHVFAGVHVQQAADDGGQSRRVDLLHVDLDGLRLVVGVEVEDEVVDEVEAVADDYERQLVGELRLLQKVLHRLRLEVVAFATHTLHFFDLPRFDCGFDVFEMDIWIL